MLKLARFPPRLVAAANPYLLSRKSLSSIETRSAPASLGATHRALGRMPQAKADCAPLALSRQDACAPLTTLLDNR